jgi:hypothetical protein
MRANMSVEEHEPDEIERLLRDERGVLDAMAQIEDQETRADLIRVLELMAVYDGELADKERAYLSRAADCLGVPFDEARLADLESQYRQVVRKGFWDQAWKKAGEAAARAKGGAAHTGQHVGEAVGAARHLVRPSRVRGQEPAAAKVDADVPSEVELKLGQLKTLFERDLISPDEYQATKTEILTGWAAV